MSHGRVMHGKSAKSQMSRVQVEIMDVSIALGIRSLHNFLCTKTPSNLNPKGLNPEPSKGIVVAKQPRWTMPHGHRFVQAMSS